MLPSPPISANSWRRCIKLSVMCTLLFDGASAFSHGRAFVPALPAATPLPYFSGSVSPFERVHRPLIAGPLAMSAERTHETSKATSIRRSPIIPMALGALALTSFTAAANAAKKGAAAAASEVAAPLVLPTIPRLALVCLLPTLLGYARSEYGVSYGYGTAMAASSYLILSSIATAAGLPLLPGIQESLSFKSFEAAGILTSLSTTLKNLRALLPKSLPAFHAFALFFYGTRLDLFLFYREAFLPRFRAMRERIEERAKKQGGRLKRTPFILSCAFLYFCMMSPLLVTGQLCEGVGMACPPGLALGGGLTSILEQSLRSTVAVALLGFLLGALGDLNKTLGKAIQGEDALITGGIFRFFRHPNYTGEVIGWVSSCFAAFLAVAWKASADAGGGSLALSKSMAPYLLLSVMGATGISFVLATATTGLEFRQNEKYGDTDEYKDWIKKSWVGFKMTPTQQEEKEADEEGSEE
ncbi:hypothetical protein ACHAXT_007434 [Thalassiosira profunda]